MTIDYGVPISTQFSTSSYCTPELAGMYFASRLNSDPWDDATDDDKLKALITATRKIDTLNFEGVKTVADHEMEFPRDGSTIVPEGIIIACCEIALVLLDGVDPEQEMAALNTSSQSFASVRETYSRTFAAEHLRAGIPSAIAWNHLLPFLHDECQLTLSRVS